MADFQFSSLRVVAVGGLEYKEGGGGMVLIVDRRQSRGWLIVEGGEKREAKTGRSGTGPIRAGTLRVSLPGNETHPNTRGEKTPRGYHPAIQSTPKVIAPLRDAPFNVAIELRPRRPDTCGLLRSCEPGEGINGDEENVELSSENGCLLGSNRLFVHFVCSQDFDEFLDFLINYE